MTNRYTDPAVTRTLGTIIDQGYRAGHLTLPEPITQLVTAVDVLTAGLRETREAKSSIGLPDLRTKLVDDLLAAAKTGKTLPEAQELDSAKRDLARLDEDEKARLDALNIIEESLAGQISALRSDIITQHLRPAIAEIVSEARRIVRKLKGLDFDASALVVAGVRATADWARLLELEQRYGAIRAAQRALVEHAVETDKGMQWMEFRNMHQVWPGLVSTRNIFSATAPQPPWRVEEAGRKLAWIAQNEHAEVWVPLPHEQDAAAEAHRLWLADRQQSGGQVAS